MSRICRSRRLRSPGRGAEEGFAGVTPGRYALEVRSAGYHRVADTVRVTRDSGATVLAVLTRDPDVRGGCGAGDRLAR